MTRLKKILHQFYTNPTRLRYRDIEKILLNLGCIKIQAKGSHVKFKHNLAKFDYVIPVHHNGCKEFYNKGSIKIY